MSSTSEPVIQCRNVWKLFGQHSEQALQAMQQQGLSKQQVKQQFDSVVGVADASFSVERGEIFCIMGLSGSGKSTLVRHINRLIEPTGGEILIDGQSIGEMDANALRQLRASKIGMVFQHTALLPHRSVRENVALGLELRGVAVKERLAIASEKLALVQLEGWEDRRPDELSGGMQQRVGLARAMAADPDILLMDEPFSALDPLIRHQLQDQFLALANQMYKTTLFITHDLDEAMRIGHRIAIMKDGAIVQIGTPEQIVTQPADDYVAEFVKNISLLNLVSAGKLAISVEQYRREGGCEQQLAAAPSVAAETHLRQLIDTALSQPGPIVVQQGDHQLGVITTRQLLEGITGGRRHAA